MSYARIVHANEADVLRIEDRRNGRVVIVSAVRVLQRQNADEAGTSLETALAGMVRAQAAGTTSLAHGKYSDEAIAAYVAQMNDAVHQFALAFANALLKAATGGTTTAGS